MVHYDNIIPIGDNCSISIILKELGLRNKAYPFDWCSHIGGNPKYSIIDSNIRVLLELLENENITDFEQITTTFLGERDRIFPHEHGTQNEIQNKYTRRFQRLHADVTNTKNKNLFILVTRCYLINNDLLSILYNILLKINPLNHFIFISGINHDLNLQYYTNLTFNHIDYNESLGWLPDNTTFRPAIKNVLHDEINKKQILFVTAYKDINRSTWMHYGRSNKEYFECFFRLAQNIEFNLVVYIEDKTFQELNLLYKFKPNIIFKSLNSVVTFYDKYLNEDRKIITSAVYKNKIPIKRITNPEHVFSEYNLINHSKINFISHAKQSYTNYDFYSWIDFGYVKYISSVPTKLKIDTNKLPNKIIYHYLKCPDLNNKVSEAEMLRSDDIYLTGSSFIVDSTVVSKFEYLYENKIKDWQSKNLTDDDQNLVLQLYYDNPELFCIIHNNAWFSLFNILQNIV